MPIVCLVTKVSLLLEVWFSRGFFVLFSNVTQLLIGLISFQKEGPAPSLTVSPWWGS